VGNLSRISAVVRAGHFLPRPEIAAAVERLAADAAAPASGRRSQAERGA